MNKSDIRKSMKKRRDSLSQTKKSALNRSLFGVFKHIFKEPEKLVVLSYISTQSEAKTLAINNYLLKNGCKIYVPHIKGDQILPVRYIKGCKMKKGAYGIKEPYAKKYLKSIKEIDLVLVPGIAFDIKGNRIGFGKGYFDRFLKKLSTKSMKTAIAFDLQILDTIPGEKHDVKMDLIITEKGVIPVNKKLLEL